MPRGIIDYCYNINRFAGRAMTKQDVAGKGKGEDRGGAYPERLIVIVKTGGGDNERGVGRLLLESANETGEVSGPHGRDRTRTPGERA
jgi:hypothetical protein